MIDLVYKVQNLRWGQVWMDEYQSVDYFEALSKYRSHPYTPKRMISIKTSVLLLEQPSRVEDE